MSSLLLTISWKSTSARWWRVRLSQSKWNIENWSHFLIPIVSVFLKTLFKLRCFYFLGVMRIHHQLYCDFFAKAETLIGSVPNHIRLNCPTPQSWWKGVVGIDLSEKNVSNYRQKGTVSFFFNWKTKNSPYRGFRDKKYSHNKIILIFMNYLNDYFLIIKQMMSIFFIN